MSASGVNEKAIDDGSYGTIAQALRFAPLRHVVPPTETVLTRFQSGHGWTSSGFASINLNDTTETGGMDIQAVTGTTDGAGTGAFLNSPALTAFDPTSKHFVVWVKIADSGVADGSGLANINAATLRLGADSSFTNSTTLTSISNGSSVLSNEWTRLVFSMANPLSTTGTGVGTACVKAQLKLQDKNAKALSVAYGGIAYRAQPSVGTVVFTFDDSFASVFTDAKAALSKYRYRATVFPILDNIGTAGRATLAQLIELQDLFGWEIGGHCNLTADHTPGFASLTADQLEAEMQAMKAWQAANGIWGTSLAYPSDAYNRSVVNAAKRYWSCARTTDPGQQETFPAWDHYRIRSYAIASGDSLATLEGKVDTAVTYGQTLVFTIHDVSAGGVITVANFGSLVDYVNGKGASVQVRTLAEAVAGLATAA